LQQRHLGQSSKRTGVPRLQAQHAFKRIFGLRLCVPSVLQHNRF
jgi:hypothetical protein